MLTIVFFGFAQKFAWKGASTTEWGSYIFACLEMASSMARAPQCRWNLVYLTAMATISNSTPLGRAAACTQKRAGASPGKQPA